MILVDSSVWIDYFRGTVTPETEKLDSLLGQQPLAIGDLILTLQRCFRVLTMIETSMSPERC